MHGQLRSRLRQIREHCADDRQSRPLEKSVADDKPDFTCNVSKETYCRMVEKTKEYIVDGDIFQAVISRQFSSEYHGSLLNAYRVLRTTNPSPYMVYLCMDDTEIMSTSPETLVRLKDGRLTTFPVAGSRPRALRRRKTPGWKRSFWPMRKSWPNTTCWSTSDETISDGSQSFHRGGHRIPDDPQILPHYAHLLPGGGDILKGCDAFSAIEAVLPAGTLSGAPKIRACEIIEELEPVPRGIYGGALGYIDFTGKHGYLHCDPNGSKDQRKVYVQAGGGIVADSVPEKKV